MTRIPGTIVLAFALMAQAAVGEEIYRTVDEQGNVTFTDSPPEEGVDTERVELPPGPSEQDRQSAEQRNRMLLQKAEEADRKREREKREREARIKAAQRRLEQAQTRLTEAKVIKDEDRQNLAGGKRRIHPDYFERVKKAKMEVDEARKALREVRGY